MVNFTLRPAVQDDYDFLYHLIEVCMKVYVDEIWGWDDAFQKNYFAENFNTDDCQIILVDGKQAGQITVSPAYEKDFLAAIYILPEFQNMGLGSALILEVMANAAEKGRSVTLQVLKSNKPARRLYERLGFYETADRVTRYSMQWDPPG